MTARLDKHGQRLRIADLVRLPSAELGFVRCFSVRSGRERAVVRYERRRLGEVTLLPHLVESLNWKCARCWRNGHGRRGEAHRSNRVPRGESHYRAQLSDRQVREMRDLHRRAGKGYMLLASIFGCGVSTARDICTLRTRRDA